MALRYLSLSPHYFGRTPDNKHLNARDFLEFEFRRSRRSRELIIAGLVEGYIEPNSVCLDYGCGPGFLAHAAAQRAARVIACDISKGVITCAGVLNPAPNIEYRLINPNGDVPVPTGSIDVAYSFAVIQHVTDDVFRGILRQVQRVMKPGVTFVCHVVIDALDGGWRVESQWRADTSLRGRLRRKYALQCFTRSRADFENLASDAGFQSFEIIQVQSLPIDLRDDIGKQQLCVFRK
jgi:SAM-dependent methyltransferase